MTDRNVHHCECLPLRNKEHIKTVCVLCVPEAELVEMFDFFGVQICYECGMARPHVLTVFKSDLFHDLLPKLRKIFRTIHSQVICRIRTVDRIVSINKFVRQQSHPKIIKIRTSCYELTKESTGAVLFHIFEKYTN